MNSVKMRGGKEKVAPFLRHFRIIERTDRRGNRLHDSCSISKGGGFLCSCLQCVFSKPVRIEFRGNLGTDKLGGKAAECNPRRFLVIHCVNGKTTPAVKVAFDRFVFQVNTAGDIPIITAIVAQSVHIQLRNDKLSGVCPLRYERGVCFQYGRFGRKFVHIVKLIDVLLKG